MTICLKWTALINHQDMEVVQQLKQFGLNQSEIAVYLFLLENGVSTPPIVSRGTSIARTNCYNVLEELKLKGLVQEQESGKRKAYIARDPESLLLALEKKREVALRLVPDLRAIYTTQKNKPKIRFYDGIEQVKQIYKASLEAGQIYGFTSMEHFLKVFPDFGLVYLKEVAEHKIFFRDILSHSSRDSGAQQMKDIVGAYYDYRFLEAKYENFPTDIMIWNDNIAFLTLEEPIFGTIMTNKTLANTFKIMHDVMWSVAK